MPSKENKTFAMPFAAMPFCHMEGGYLNTPMNALKSEGS